MQLRRTLLSFGAVALLLGDLAGCSTNPDAPSAPSAPSGASASDKESAPDAGGGVAVKGKKSPGQKAASSRVSGTE